MDTELKPCPFCGEEAGICEANDICFHRDDDGNKIFGGWRCFCPSCAIEQIGYETREEAVSAWNNRSTEHATHRAPVDEKGGGRMTGIDRLRTLAGAWDEWGLGGPLAEMADEIERERACDADAIENVRLIVGGVIDDVERHVSGHEGADDSPVARWARELRRALKSDTSDAREAQNPSCHDPAETADVSSEVAKVTRDPAEDVSVSAYDLLPQEERDAIAWVREHGGLERVKAQRRESMPRAAYERKKAGFLGHIAECETALGRRNERISELEERVRVRERANDELNEELNAMRPRLMPEGMGWLVEVWPRFKDDAPVRLLDDFERYGEENGVGAVTMYADGSFSLNFRAYSKGERVNRPAPKVLDADGVEIRKGDTVWTIKDARKLEVIGLYPEQDSCPVKVKERKPGARIYFGIDPDQLTHRAPVLAADGRPLREGETVWDTKGNGPYIIDAIEGDGVVRIKGNDLDYLGADFTHERPDSWERLEEDAGMQPHAYCVGHMLYGGEDEESTTPTNELFARDLVRRCRALAERERGE